jgi:N-acetylneuraminic acid mutarotase
MAYDPSTKKVILFGGATPTALFNDTWAYDSTANTWTKLKPSGTPPSPRVAASVAYDAVTQQLILFGGADADTELDDTWAFAP